MWGCQVKYVSNFLLNTENKMWGYQVSLAAVFSASEDISDNLTRKAPDNSTEKCRTLLANLLELSTNESKAIESEVRKLTQGLIFAEVEPEEYCTKLERLLHASPQPSLIHFLQKTLPMLRQALVTKELVIEGIDPPEPRGQVSDTDTAYSAVQDADFTDTDSTKKKSKVLQKKPVSRKIKPGKVVKTKGRKNKNKRKELEILLSTNFFSDDVAPVQSLDERKPFSPPATKAEPEVEAVPEEEAEAAEPHVVGETSVDGDINDVVKMAGVDVAEEYQNRLRSTKKINAEGRKLPEEKHLLDLDKLRLKINAYLARQGLSPPSPNIALCFNYFVTEKIKNILERLTAVTKARYAQQYMMQDGCEITSNVKGQLDFLREVDMCNQKRAERERAKAREADPEAQQVQLNEEGETTETVTEAVGERSGQAHEGDAQGSGADSSADAGPSTSASAQADGDEQPAKGPMFATMRDLIFVLEQDKDFARSPLLYALYLYH